MASKVGWVPTGSLCVCVWGGGLHFLFKMFLSYTLHSVLFCIRCTT